MYVIIHVHMHTSTHACVSHFKAMLTGNELNTPDLKHCKSCSYRWLQCIKISSCLSVGIMEFSNMESRDASEMSLYYFQVIQCRIPEEVNILN